MAAISRPVKVLIKGALKTVDDIERIFLEKPLGEKGKAQGLEKGGTLHHGDPVENGDLLPGPGFLGIPAVSKDMDIVPLNAEPLDQLGQITLGSPERRVGFTDESDFHKKV
jgi:hypothetical protein